MVTEHLGMGIVGCRKDGLQGLVKGLDPAPGLFQQAEPSGHDIAAGRHAGGRTTPVAVKDNAAASQPVDIGGQGRICRMIGRQHPQVQGIAQDEDRFHALTTI